MGWFGITCVVRIGSSRWMKPSVMSEYALNAMYADSMMRTLQTKETVPIEVFNMSHLRFCYNAFTRVETILTIIIIYSGL